MEKHLHCEPVYEAKPLTDHGELLQEQVLVIVEPWGAVSLYIVASSTSPGLDKEWHPSCSLHKPRDPQVLSLALAYHGT